MPRVPESFLPEVGVSAATTDYQRIQADASMFGGGVATALRNAGNQIEGGFDSLANDYVRDITQTARFSDQAALSTFEGQEMQRLKDTAANTTDAAFGFTNKFVDEQKKLQEQFLQGKPPLEAARLKAQLAEMNAQFSTRAYAVEQQKRGQYVNTQLGTQWDTQANGIIDDPKATQFYKDRMYHLIDESPGTAEQKQAWKQKVDEEAPHFYAQSMAQKDPAHVIESLGGDSTYFKRLRASEGGATGAKSATSSAEGPYQITTGTWKDIVNNYGGKEAGLTAEGRLDPAQQEIGVRLLTKHNGEFLSKNNVPVTEANLRMAHFLGPQGMVDLYQKMVSNPGAPITSVASPDQLAANKSVFYEKDEKGRPDTSLPKTVSQVYAAQTRGYDGARAVSVQGSDPFLNQLDPKARVNVVNYAEREQAQQQNAIAAQAKAQQQEWYNDFLTRIHDGQAGMSDIQQARESGHLTDIDQIIRAEKMATEKVDKISTLDTALAKLSMGASWNPAAQDDHKLSDALYEEYTGRGGQGPRQAGATVAYQTGIVPKGFAEYMAGGFVSGDVRKVQEVGDISMRMLMEKPTIFYGTEKGKELQENAALYSSELEKGRSPEQAAAAVVEQQRPDVKLNLGKTADIDAFRKNIAQKDQSKVVADLFGSWYPGANPKLPDAQMAAIQSDYKDFATEHFSKYHNEAAAESYAKQQMKINYGVNSQGLLMKYPPENFFPAVGGKHNWIYQQAAGKVAAATGVEVTPDKVFLTPLSGLNDGISTALNVRSGKGPVYGLAFLDKDGVLQSIKRVDGGNLGWKPDSEEAFARWRDTGGLIPVDSIQNFPSASEIIAATPRNPLKGVVPINPNAARPGGGF